MKLLIIGHPHSGKTQLAKDLSQITKIEFISYYPLLSVNPDVDPNSLIYILTNNKVSYILDDFPMDKVDFDTLIYLTSLNHQRPHYLNQLKEKLTVLEISSAYGKADILSQTLLGLYKLDFPVITKYVDTIKN